MYVILPTQLMKYVAIDLKKKKKDQKGQYDPLILYSVQQSHKLSPD